MPEYRFEWRGRFDNPSLNALHAGAFDHPVLEDDWEAQVRSHSLGWVTVHDDDELVGFVNVAWDGGAHAFLLDPVVSPRLQRQGIGTRMIGMAAQAARAVGCQWLHVDFEDHLRPFYIDACGFQPTQAGLIAL